MHSISVLAAFLILAPPTPPQVAGPYTHGKLAVYVIRGPEADARSYITLDEGLESGVAKSARSGAATSIRSRLKTAPTNTCSFTSAMSSVAVSRTAPSPPMSCFRPDRRRLPSTRFVSSTAVGRPTPLAAWRSR